MDRLWIEACHSANGLLVITTTKDNTTAAATTTTIRYYHATQLHIKNCSVTEL